jgi:hypothetical protein
VTRVTGDFIWGMVGRIAERPEPATRNGTEAFITVYGARDGMWADDGCGQRPRRSGCATALPDTAARDLAAPSVR